MCDCNKTNLPVRTNVKKATYTLGANQTRNINVPEGTYKIVLGIPNTGSVYAGYLDQTVVFFDTLTVALNGGAAKYTVYEAAQGAYLPMNVVVLRADVGGGTYFIEFYHYVLPNNEE